MGDRAASGIGGSEVGRGDLGLGSLDGVGVDVDTEENLNCDLGRDGVDEGGVRGAMRRGRKGTMASYASEL